jgi:hypothetical protein
LTAAKEQQGAKCVDFCSSNLIFYLGAINCGYIRLHPAICGYLRLSAAICGYLRPRQWLLLLILIRPNIEIALQKICF